MLIIDEPGAPKEADISFWQRVREAFRCKHPEGYNVNPPALMIIRPPVAPKAPPPVPNRCCRCRTVLRVPEPPPTAVIGDRLL